MSKDNLSRVDPPSDPKAIPLPRGVGPKNPKPPAAPPPGPPQTPGHIELSSEQGSAIHIAHLNLLNKNLVIQKLQAQVDQLKEKMAREAKDLEELRKEAKKLLDEHKIPDQWRFDRKEDGSYVFYPSPPPGPGTSAG